MTQAVNTTSNTHTNKPNAPWYRPTLSPEHGVYVVLLVSFLLGAAVAQNWTLATTLALVCAFCGFQAEHPMVLQIKQRRSLKPRFLIWGGVYAVISGAMPQGGLPVKARTLPLPQSSSVTVDLCRCDRCFGC